jgi:hypothetical protein
MRGQSSLLNKSPNIRLQSFLQIIQKALDMNWESIYKNDVDCLNRTALCLRRKDGGCLQRTVLSVIGKYTTGDLRKDSIALVIVH